MATNKLTPEQDILTRRFYLEVAQTEGLFPDAPIQQKRLCALLMDMLNYQRLGNGNFVTKGTPISVPFGNSMPSGLDAYPDEWVEDYQRAVDALTAEGEEDVLEVTAETPEAPASIEDQFAFDANDTSEASTSESSESTEVREAVLSEDV
jgi:hypothetical protein